MAFVITAGSCHAISIYCGTWYGIWYGYVAVNGAHEAVWYDVMAPESLFPRLLAEQSQKLCLSIC